MLRQASAERRKVLPFGHGTKLGMGGAGQPIDLAISLERLSSICEYPASDLTITVEAGLPLRDLAAALAEKRQMLPLDVPFADRATVGGTIAANVNGPRRLGYGSWRDIVLGVHYVTADGKLAKGGGRVVKNVAGYDIPKLLIGSLGTLGVIVAVTFKVFPLPPAQATLVMGFRTPAQAAQAAQRIVHSQLLPQALDLIDAPAAGLIHQERWLHAPCTLLAAIAGPAEVLARFERDLPVMVRPQGLESVQLLQEDQENELWRSVREITPAFLAAHPDGAVVKASLPLASMSEFLEQARAVSQQHALNAATLARAGSGIVYSMFWPKEGRPPIAAGVEWLIRQAEQRGGRAVVEWCPEALQGTLNRWGTLGDDFPAMRQLKAALDPGRILSPGRFYGGI